MSGIAKQSKRALYEFGPFRVDAEKELLLRAGVPIALTPKAFQILLTLVRGGGELVTKDEIMKAVWPDTFVEETNLTRNIFSLRRALGESPGNQYILTVSGKGYRLAQSVQPISQDEINILAATRSTVELHVEEGKSRQWINILIIGISVLAVALVAFYFVPRRAPHLSGKDAVVIAEFANSTGDPIFDETLRQGLAVHLEQSPFLSIVSDERVQHTLQLMSQASNERFTAAIAREVCQRIGATALLEGSIANLGRQYVLGLKATRCDTGDLLDVEQATAANKEQVLDALSQMASRFRRRVGESLSTMQMHDKPLEEATTSSLDALRAYSLGNQAELRESVVAGVPFLKRAIELDPRFALAHANLALAYADSGQSGPAFESARRAYELRDRVSDREKFFISVIFDRIVTGDLERARQTCSLWARTYPRDAMPHSIASGGILQGVGDFEGSIEEARTAIAMDPDIGPAHVNLAFSYFALGRTGEAEQIIQQASGRGLDPPEMLFLRYSIAFLKNDTVGMNRVVALAQGKPWAEDWLTQAQALTAADAGQLQLARKLSQRAVELALREEEPERAAGYEASFAVYEAFIGDPKQARGRAAAALKLSRGRDIEYTTGLVSGMLGDLSKAEELLKDLQFRFPEDTTVNRFYLPVLRAAIAMKNRAPQTAIDDLQVALSHEMALVGDGSAVLGNVHSAYMRGEAYLAVDRVPEALSEFQKLLDHPGLCFNDPLVTLAQLQIGHGYALLRDRIKARSAYEAFFRRWEFSDPDLPIFNSAKSEYNAIQ
jgi:DNA-binding winged helix-turn-helix (wHTH) protein/tetratricopeptide (TPR) repeat protein